MKKAFTSLLAAVISPLVLLSVSDAAYVIHLKNGGRFLTGLYWEEERAIKFCINDGVVGVAKDFVARIDRAQARARSDDGDDVGTPEAEERTRPEITPPPPPPPAEPVAEKAAVKEEKQVNIQEYRDKKAQLKIELDEWVEKLREATRQKDDTAKEKARLEMRKVAAQIYNLTAEVKEKNKGALPEGWWDD